MMVLAIHYFLFIKQVHKHVRVGTSIIIRWNAKITITHCIIRATKIFRTDPSKSSGGYIPWEHISNKSSDIFRKQMTSFEAGITMRTSSLYVHTL